MMHPVYHTQPAASLPVPYSQDALFDDLSRQMATSQSCRRPSRGSAGQRSGTAMRVMKPTSANNSPRSSGVMSRRKTLMNDGNAQRRQQVLEQMPIYHGNEQQPQQTVRPSRPVSWHPNMYGQQQLHLQYQQSTYPVSTANMYADQQDMWSSYPQLSPMLSSHSCNTSPASAFSPLSLPFQTDNNVAYMPPNASLPQQVPTTMPAQFAQETYSTSDESAAENMTYTNGWDWNSFIMQGYNSTSPPTPEAFPQTELSQPAVSEESISYQALDDSTEDEGEILVGMGLYDTPDKYDNDPQLNNYRSTVSSLLGSTFRHPEPKGKGLKLEETWEPPKSDDEEEEEDEQDDDE